MNYYNTQESSAKYNNDHSKYLFNTVSQNIFSNENNKENKIFWSPKIEDCFYKKARKVKKVIHLKAK